MPTNKSALKRMGTTKKQHMRNKARKSAIATAEKKFRTALETNDEQALKLMQVTHGLLDKAVKAGVIHRNKANRKKSQLNKLLKETAKETAKE